jgi:opacity protein-like surface antigen
MKIRKALLITTAAAALSLAAPSAYAASSYASLFGGANFLQKPGLNGTAVTHSTTLAFQSKTSIDTSFKTGYVVGANMGIDWGGLRTELEIAVRENHSSKSAHLVTHYALGYVTAANGFPYTSGSRDENVSSDIRMRTYSLMANAWYDFHALKFAGFTPYAGGGVGMALVQIGGQLAGHNLYEKNQTVFSWQAGGGVSTPLTDWAKLFLDFRHFQADHAKLRIEPGFHGGLVHANADGDSVMLGIRFGL